MPTTPYNTNDVPMVSEAECDSNANQNPSLVYSIRINDNGLSYNETVNAGSHNTNDVTQIPSEQTASESSTFFQEERRLTDALRDIGADVNVTWREWGKTVLFYASEKNKSKWVRTWIDGGAEVNVLDKQGQNALFAAVESDDRNVVRALVDAGIDVNVFDKQGENSLSLAVKKDKGNVVRALIDAGADVDIIDEQGRTVLFNAVKHDNENIVRALIDAGADVNSTDYWGETALFNVIKHDNANVVCALIEAGADVNIIDNDGQNALFKVVQYLLSEVNVSRTLIDAGSDVNLTDNYGKTALFNAAFSGKEDVVLALIDAAANVNVIDDQGKTALFCAAQNDNEVIVRSLIDAGGDVNVIDKQGQTTLICAVQNNNEEIVRSLIDAGAHVNIIDKEGWHSLFYSTRNENEKVTCALIDAGADVNVTDKQGQNALFNAVQYNNENVARALINAGVDVNVIDKEGQNALFYSARNENEKVNCALIDAGADVKVIDKKGQNALFCSARNGNEKVSCALVDAGADVNVLDKQGQTALVFAIKNDNVNVVRAFIDAGADVNTTDNKGQNALFKAVEQDKETVVRLLLSVRADVNYTDVNGQTPLFSIVKQDKGNMARALIDAGAKVNLTDKWGKTALFNAVEHNSEDVARALIDAGIDVNVFHNEGKTALFYVKEHYDSLSVARALIEYGGALVDVRDHFGRTPLFYAITKSLALTKYILEKGADPNTKDNKNVNLCSFFVESFMKKENYFLKHRKEDIRKALDVLIKYGVKKKSVLKTISNAVFCRMVFFTSSLGKNENLEYLIILLELGRDNVAKDDNETHKILQNVIMKSKRALRNRKLNTSLLQTFLASLMNLGANPDAADIHGNTALHHATRLTFSGVPLEEVMEICQQLISFKANVNFKNWECETPFLFCLSGELPEHMSEKPKLYCIKTVIEVCKFLLKHGSNVNEVSKNGESVFHLIMKLVQRVLMLNNSNETLQGQILNEIIVFLQLLVSRFNLGKRIKAVNKRDSKLNSPLHFWASLQLHPSRKYDETLSKDSHYTFQELLNTILKHLLQCGAKMNEINENKETPLHSCRTWTAVKLLIDAGTNTKEFNSQLAGSLFAAAKKKLFYQSKDRFYPDVLQEPKEFWRTAVENNLDPWFVEKNGESVLSILIESEEFVLAKALVEFARDDHYLQSDKIAASLLNTICKDRSIRSHWKSNLVEIILKAKKRSFSREGGKDSPLHYCCTNIVASEENRNTIPENIEQSVHWNIVKQLLMYGADCKVADAKGQSCLDIAESCPSLACLLLKPIDINEIPLLIPWSSVSKRYEQKLAKVARQQECERVDSFWYHKEHLAGGSFGFVFAGINNRDGREVAIKRMETLRMDRREDVREIANLKALADCEQVVCYLSFFEDDVSHFSYVVLELMEGNLDEYLDNFYDRKENVKLCKNVVIGLNFLHDLNILHRDLKPTNILYKTHPKLCLKIADFGLSRRIDSCSTTVYGSNAGTRCWIAPEVLKSKNAHSKSSDIFACGLILHYIMSARKHPFAPADCANKSILELKHETETNVIKDIMEGWDDSLCPEAAHLSKEMLESDLRRRPSAAKSLTHPFFWSNKKKIDLLVAVGNQPEFECPRAHRSTPLSAVERDLETTFGITAKLTKWNDPGYAHMPAIYNEMKTKRRTPYNPFSAVELVRFIRNAYEHVSADKRSTLIRKLLLEDFVFLKCFPNLVMEVYKALTNYGWDMRDEINYAING